MTKGSRVKHAKEGEPYPPSFVDRLMAWIERLPGPAWGFYALAALVIVALGHGLRWLDGSLPAGSFDPERFATDAQTIYPLAILHLLNSTARRSLDDFRPALGKLEAEYEKLRYELTTLSPRFVLIATLIGFLVAALNLTQNPVGWGITSQSSLITNIVAVLFATLSIVSFIGFIGQAIRQVRLIAYIHRSATKINLYESQSHHAFARLTMRTSIGIVFPIYFFTFFLLLFDPNATEGMPAIDTITISIVILISIALFILPLLGMRRRLLDEKTRLLVESDRRFEAAARKLHQRVDADSLERMDDLNKTMASLILEKDTLKKISTWPWEAETMRGFLSSVGLPILLWLITTYLGKFL